MAPNVRKIMIYFTAVTSMTRELGARGKSAVFTIRGLNDFRSALQSPIPFLPQAEVSYGAK